MIKSSDQPHHQSFFETLQLYWFYFRPWVFKRFDLFMISASWQVHSMPDLKCTKVPFQLCAKIHCMCVGRSHKNSRKIEKLYKNMRVVYLIYLSILFSRYRSCDDTLEVWTFVLLIKKTACKDENVQLWEKILSLVSWHDLYGEQNNQEERLYRKLL